MDINCGLNRLTFTAETEGGKGSSRAFSANTRGNPSGIDPRPVAMKHNIPAVGILVCRYYLRLKQANFHC